MIISSLFDIGQIIYIKTDKEQCARMIIAIIARQTGVQYELNYGSASSWHYEIELSETKDILTATTG